jgi:hypothetical protein
MLGIPVDAIVIVTAGEQGWCLGALKGFDGKDGYERNTDLMSIIP